MGSEWPGHLRSAEGLDPVQRLWQELPIEWRGPVIGEGIENWTAVTENGERRLDLSGLPDPLPAELAWMAHWQAGDGTRSSVVALNQLANILRRALRANHPFPASIRAMDWPTAAALQGGSTPPGGGGCHRRAAERDCGSCSASVVAAGQQRQPGEGR